MRVLLVDDDHLVCTSLRTILQATGIIEVVGMGHNGEEAIRLYKQLKPDILLMDIRMDTMSGITASGQILAEFPEAKILFLTTFSDDEYIIQALRLGAKGYILKQEFESIVPTLKAVFSGQSVFGDSIVNKMPRLLKGENKPSFSSLGISEREERVIDLVAKGLSNKEIAETLFLSEGTIRNYISVILDKLELRDRTQLAVFYLTQGGNE